MKDDNLKTLFAVMWYSPPDSPIGDYLKGMFSPYEMSVFLGEFYRRGWIERKNGQWIGSSRGQKMMTMAFEKANKSYLTGVTPTELDELRTVVRAHFIDREAERN